MFKKVELHNYIEQVRDSANAQIYEFFKSIDPDTAPNQIKLLYYYYVGSRNLYQELSEESVQEFKLDNSSQNNMFKQEKSGMFKMPAQKTRDKIKKRYGKSLAEMQQFEQSIGKVSKKKKK